MIPINSCDRQFEASGRMESATQQLIHRLPAYTASTSAKLKLFHQHDFQALQHACSKQVAMEVRFAMLSWAHTSRAQRDINVDKNAPEDAGSKEQCMSNKLSSASSNLKASEIVQEPRTTPSLNLKTPIIISQI
jgi:hypothetical protein